MGNYRRDIINENFRVNYTDSYRRYRTTGTGMVDSLARQRLRSCAPLDRYSVVICRQPHTAPSRVLRFSTMLTNLCHAAASVRFLHGRPASAAATAVRQQQRRAAAVATVPTRRPGGSWRAAAVAVTASSQGEDGAPSPSWEEARRKALQAANRQRGVSSRRAPRRSPRCEEEESAGSAHNGAAGGSRQPARAVPSSGGSPPSTARPATVKGTSPWKPPLPSRSVPSAAPSQAHGPHGKHWHDRDQEAQRRRQNGFAAYQNAYHLPARRGRRSYLERNRVAVPQRKPTGKRHVYRPKPSDPDVLARKATSELRRGDGDGGAASLSARAGGSGSSRTPRGVSSRRSGKTQRRRMSTRTIRGVSTRGVARGESGSQAVARASADVADMRRLVFPDWDLDAPDTACLGQGKKHWCGRPQSRPFLPPMK